MTTNTKPVKSVTGNSSLLRPRFNPGQLLRDDDLSQGVDYTRDLSRLLFRSLFGCGVVCGLVVRSVFECEKLNITVGSGVALDCHGDPIYVPQPQPISLDPSCGVQIPSKMWVVIRRTEKCCAPRTAACSCDDEETPAVCTRERDGYEIRIVSELPECACGCTEPKTRDQTAQADQAGPIQQANMGAATTKPAKKSKAGANVAADLPVVPPQPPYTPVEAVDKCWCADPLSKCYEDHYQGKCSCECCDCEWVVLASVEQAAVAGASTWNVHHNVRRFVRPVLMRDWQALQEAH